MLYFCVLKYSNGVGKIHNNTTNSILNIDWAK